MAKIFHRSAGLKVYVFKLKHGEWVRITSLGDRVLLLSGFNIVCLLNKQIVGTYFEVKCVYELHMHKPMLANSLEDRIAGSCLFLMNDAMVYDGDGCYHTIGKLQKD